MVFGWFHTDTSINLNKETNSCAPPSPSSLILVHVFKCTELLNIPFSSHVRSYLFLHLMTECKIHVARCTRLDISQPINMLMHFILHEKKDGSHFWWWKTMISNKLLTGCEIVKILSVNLPSPTHSDEMFWTEFFCGRLLSKFVVE